MPPVSNCGQITAGINVNCDEPIVSGVNDTIYLFNKTEVDSLTYGATKETVQGINLQTSATGFVFEGKNDSVDPKTELEKARFSTNHNHEVVFRVFDNSVAVKTQLNKMVNGKFLVAISNNHVNSTGDSAFEIYGEISGLEVAELDRLPSDVESEASWRVVLRTPERSKEPRLPASFFETDYTTSKNNLEGLLP